jgi:hypothetical protein
MKLKILAFFLQEKKRCEMGILIIITTTTIIILKTNCKKFKQICQSSEALVLNLFGSLY